MDNFWPYLGGMIGGYTLVQAPLDSLGTGIEPVVNIVGVLSMIVFAGALIYHGARSLVGR